MKTILCVGGVAHGRYVPDLQLKQARYAAEATTGLSLQQRYVEYWDEHGNKSLIRHVDGYTRHQYDADGVIHEVMLEDTERPEDLLDLLLQAYSHGIEPAPVNEPGDEPEPKPEPQKNNEPDPYADLFG